MELMAKEIKRKMDSETVELLRKAKEKLASTRETVTKKPHGKN